MENMEGKLRRWHKHCENENGLNSIRVKLGKRKIVINRLLGAGGVFSRPPSAGLKNGGGLPPRWQLLFPEGLPSSSLEPVSLPLSTSNINCIDSFAGVGRHNHLVRAYFQKTAGDHEIFLLFILPNH